MNSEFLEITKLIAKFQALEIGLKVYIVKSQIEADRKAGKLKEGYSIDSLNELSLGLLLKRYRKINSNNEFHDRLLVLKDYRNILAHKSFLLAWPTLSEDLKISFLGHSKNPIDYNQLNAELDECIKIFVDEYRMRALSK